MNSNPKIAFVYDRVNKWGGAERVLLALHEIWPEAPLFASVYNSKTASWAEVFPRVIPSFLQNFPFAKQSHEVYPLLMPIAFESLNLEEFDVVISVTSESAKGVITKPNQLHICYCLTPTRYLWSGYMDYFKNSVKRLAFSWLVEKLRRWDLIAAQRPDCYAAISKTVQSRIKNYYHRESEVIYPPVDTNKFKVQSSKCKARVQSSKFFLVVSRLVKYKKVDLVVEAFNQLGWNLKIVGVGREMNNLKRIAKKNIEFLGQLTDQQLLSYYQDCQAVIFPTEEDFGLVPVEAMACGKPVIAYKAGGAIETIAERITGDFFYLQTVGAIVSKMQGFRVSEYKAEDCRKQAEKFSQERFKKEFKNFIEEKWRKYQKNIFTPWLFVAGQVLDFGRVPGRKPPSNFWKNFMEKKLFLSKRLSEPNY